MRSLCVTECSRGGSLHTSAGKLQDVEIVVQQIVSQNIWSIKELVCLKTTMPSMLCEGPTIAWSIIYLTPFFFLFFFSFSNPSFKSCLVNRWLSPVDSFMFCGWVTGAEAYEWGSVSEWSQSQCWVSRDGNLRGWIQLSCLPPTGSW